MASSMSNKRWQWECNGRSNSRPNHRKKFQFRIFSFPQFCTTKICSDSFLRKTYLGSKPWVLKQLIYLNIKTFAGNKKKTLFVLAFYNGAVKSKIFNLIFFKSFYQHPCWDFLDLYDAIKGWNWFMKKDFEGCITRLKCI